MKGVWLAGSGSVCTVRGPDIVKDINSRCFPSMLGRPQTIGVQGVITYSQSESAPPSGLRMVFVVWKDEIKWLEAEIGFIPGSVICVSFQVLSECPQVCSGLNSAPFEITKGLIQGWSLPPTKPRLT